MVEMTRWSLNGASELRGKGDASDFEQSMIVFARWAGLIISETPDPLGCFLSNLSGDRGQNENEKISREQQSCR